MFNDVLKEVTGIFDRRFLLNAFFPCFVFWGLLGSVVIIGLGWEPLKLLQAWNQQDTILKLLQIVGLVSLVILSAGFLLSQSLAILKFFEGYWSFPLGHQLASIGRRWHQVQFQHLDPDFYAERLSQALQALEQEREKIAERQATSQAVLNSSSRLNIQKRLFQLQVRMQEAKLQRKGITLRRQAQNIQAIEDERTNFLYESYPSFERRDQIMPTRLGNILKAAELYSLDRYELDAVLIWSRLYHLFPDRFIQIIAEARSNLDFTLSIAMLSGLFSLISGIWLLVIKAPGWLFLLCFLGGALIAWLAYQSAISNAGVYAEQIKVGFDLYRYELVKQLRLKPAQKPAEEQQQWVEIRTSFYDGQVPSTWIYVEPDAKKEDSEHG